MSDSNVPQGSRPLAGRATYSTILRAAGQWLDARWDLHSVRLMETTEGFVVQLWNADGTESSDSCVLSFAHLSQVPHDAKVGKRASGRDGGFQNLLRAVGHELDAAEAHCILLEQIADDLMLTYLYPHYIGGLALVKHFTLLDPEARQQLAKVARERRAGTKTWGLSRALRSV